MFEPKLEKFIKILLYAVPFMVLLFIEGFYFPFIITRTVFFRLIIQLSLSAYLLLLALNYRKYRPSFNWGLGLVLLFLLIQFIAAVFGWDFYQSIWSTFERMEGVSSIVYLVAYLFLLQIFFREKKQWLFYIRLILISSLLVSLYGLAQRFNLLPVFEAGVNRATSTIGNAAFLAGYLLVVLGLAAYYYFSEPDKKYRYFTLITSGFNLLVLLFTSTRGAMLGLIIGAAVYLLLNVIFAAGRLRKNSAIILVLIILAGGVFVLGRTRLAGSSIEFVRRLATISISDATVKNRLIVWRMAVDDFKEHPVLGVGMENFEFIFNKYYRPDISENWFDRTHNVYLDQLTSAGVIGLTGYLAILFYLFYLLFKKRREDQQSFAVFTALLVAYGIHNFFVFDTINTSFLYFFLIGLISLKEKTELETAVNQKPDNQTFNKVFVILLLANIFVFYKLVYLPLKINRAVYVGYYYVIADSFRSYENFKTALNYKFGSIEAMAQLNKMYDVLTANNVNGAILEKYYQLDREKTKIVSENFPLDIKSRMYLGQLILNNYQDIKELAEAESLLLRAKELSPSRLEPYYLLYNVYYQQGEKAKARAILEELVNKLPWHGGAKIMLMAELMKGEPQDAKRAEELFQQGVKQFGYGSFGGLIKIISYLLDQNRYGETVPYYLELLQAQPAQYGYRMDLAKVYYLTGEIAKAAEQIKIVETASPQTLADYQNFTDLVKQAEFNK